MIKEIIEGALLELGESQALLCTAGASLERLRQRLEGALGTLAQDEAERQRAGGAA